MTTLPTTDTEVKSVAIWQSKPCPAWCRDSGHKNDDMVGDRIHLGDERITELTLEQAVEYDADDWRLDDVRVYLMQHDEHRMPNVMMHRGENLGWRMTLGEALEFALAILDLVNVEAAAESAGSAA